MRLWRNRLLQVAMLALTQFAAADVYTELTTGQAQKIGPSYFGVHFHRLLVFPHENAVRTQWPELSFGTVRLWDSDTRWADVAPKAGVWNFDRLDTWVDTATKNHATVLYTLGSTPGWASARPDESCPYGRGCGAEPIRMAHWEEYVRRVAQRYGNRIAAYELWNEPNFSDLERDRGEPGFFTGSVSKMVEMARLARKVLDEVSPKALLCTPGFVNGPDRLDMFLAAGGDKFVQAVCYHFYAENSEHFSRQILEVRSIMKRRGVEKLPLWNTETGVETLAQSDPPSGIAARSRDEANARLNQMLILGAAAGLQRFYYYAWDNERSGMVTKQGERLSGYEAMQRLQSWMRGAKMRGCRRARDVVRCDAENGQERFIMAWANKIGKHLIDLPAGWQLSAIEPLVGEASALSVKQGPTALAITFGQMPVRLMLEPVRER